MWLMVACEVKQINGRKWREELFPKLRSLSSSRQKPRVLRKPFLFHLLMWLVLLTCVGIKRISAYERTVPWSITSSLDTWLKAQFEHCYSAISELNKRLHIRDSKHKHKSLLASTRERLRVGLQAKWSNQGRPSLDLLLPFRQIVKTSHKVSFHCHRLHYTVYRKKL